MGVCDVCEHFKIVQPKNVDNLRKINIIAIEEVNNLNNLSHKYLISSYRSREINMYKDEPRRNPNSIALKFINKTLR